jgi:hypothetical protein
VPAPANQPCARGFAGNCSDHRTINVRTVSSTTPVTGEASKKALPVSHAGPASSVCERPFLHSARRPIMIAARPRF